MKKELAKCGQGVSNPQECIEFAIEYSLKIPSLWGSPGYTEKQKLQFLIFPEGIFYNRKEDRCRTDNANGAFQYIAELRRLLEKSKSRTSIKKIESAALVVQTGQISNMILSYFKKLYEKLSTKEQSRVFSQLIVL